MKASGGINESGLEQLDKLMMELQLSDNDRYSTQSQSYNQSILGVMKNFIEAVNDMDETVLIPSRLLDMQPDSTSPMDCETNTRKKQGDLSLVSATQSSQTPNLHAYYTMLKAVKTELVRGPSKDEDDNLSEDLDNESDSGAEELHEGVNSCPQTNQKLKEATAKAFREHLNGLFNVLEQLTGMTQSLTSKYQTELGDDQSCIRPKAFSM